MCELVCADAVDLARDRESLVGEYLVVSDVDGLCHRDRLYALALLSPLVAPQPPDHGAPEPFVPVDGRRLPLVVLTVERAIVYVWREDCPPCDLMRDDLEAVVDGGLGDIALFAVYGPDAMNVLADRYRVTGAPMTLFFLDGSVDARLRGANHPEVIQKEIEKLRART
jgi:thiol-disulfide isomerase/thioredoxin